MAKYLLLLCCTILLTSVSAQTFTTLRLGKDKIFKQYGTEPRGSVPVTIRQEKGINNMLLRHYRINQESKGLKGWRVQIFFSSGRDAMDKANQIKNNFEEEYPEISAYVIYQAPYFKVRVGDFRKTEKMNALKLKKEISSAYSTTWVVEDLIELPKL